MDTNRFLLRCAPVAILLAAIGASHADGGFPPSSAANAVSGEAGRSGPVAAQAGGPGATFRRIVPAAVATAAALPAGTHGPAGFRADASPPEAAAPASATVVAASARGTGGRGARRMREAAYAPVPLQSSIDRVQPMTGIVLWNDNTGDLAALGDDVQLEFAYFKYSQVSNDQGVYDWSAVDARLASAAARGHQMIMRFHDTYPGETAISIPAYVANAPGYELAYHSVEGQQTFVPDWRSTLLQQFMLEFYTRFAQRYDLDPRLAFVQVGFGSYAEYHLWDGPLTLGRTFPSKAFQQQFLEHLGAAFAQTPWSLSIDAASGTYSPFSAVPALRELRFGLFDDSFMHETHSEDDQEYNRASWLFFGAQRHHDAPAGGEFNYYSDYDQEHVLDTPDGAWGRSFESFAAQYHVSYMIGNDQPRYQPRARIRQAAMATGYAFRVTALSSNGECARVTVRNEGVAPIYYDAWPAANGQRTGASLKGLLPGAERTGEACIGPHDPGLLEIAIDSDRLVPGQQIQFNASLP